MRKIARILKNGFKSTGISFEEKIYNYEGETHVGYVVYQNSIIFWLPAKDKIAICIDMDQLKEVNIRCNLGLKI